MESKNLNYCFNREYYTDGMLRNPESEATQKAVASHNRYIVEQIPKYPYNMDSDPLKDTKGFSSFSNVRVAYPGLLIGTGYPHNAKVKGEFQMGCTLDYVTGLPYIPGSGVKGALRAAFSDQALIENLLKELGIKETIKHEDLVNSIFGDPKHCGKDIFLDAHPIYEKGYPLLAPDAIAPHGGEENALKNPIPIPMLKIAPGTRFCFRFILTDYRMDTVTITAEQKLDLFRALVCFFGVGAKTNSGYGHFDAWENEVECKNHRTAPAETASAPRSNQGGNHSNNNNRGANQHRGNNRGGARNDGPVPPGTCPVCRTNPIFGNLPTCLICHSSGNRS